MITATQVRHITFPGTSNIHLYRFTVPSVSATSSSPDIKFLLHNPSKFENLRMSCNSKNYNFSLFLEPAIVLPSIEEIYRVVNVGNTDFDDNVDLWWAKPAGPDQHALFGVVKNNDSVSTGIISFEFVLVNY